MAKAHVAPIITKQDGKVIIQLYSPHEAQKRIHRSTARFRVVPCGRRVGKTLFAANEMSKFVVEHADVACVWISPVYRQGKLVYRLIKRALRDLVTHWSDNDLQLTLWNNSRIDFYSATNPDAMRGNRWHLAIFDETADIPEEVWIEVVRPALSDTQGRAIFIGTPKGRNWFYRLYMRGLDNAESDYESFTFPTSANPYIPRSEIEAAKKDLPEDTFLQEYTAKFLEESAGVFRGIDKCIQGEYEEVIPGMFYVSKPPVPGHIYCGGWDVAKHADWSVLTIMDTQTMHVDALYRLNKVDYTAQIERTAYLANLYNNAAILQDATGVGDPVLEMLKSKGVTAEGFVYTNISKKLLIEGLQVAIEHQNISFPNIPVLIGELRTMQYKVTPGRNITYEAPKGYHDDCVNSLALAKHAIGDNQMIPIGLTGRNEDNPLPIIEYENRPELMQRQAQVSRFLGDVQLVYGDDNEGW